MRILLALVFLNGALWAGDPCLIAIRTESLSVLPPNERNPLDRGISIERAGSTADFSGLKEGDYIVSVVDKKLGVVWSKRDPENGQRPKSQDETQHVGHDSLAPQIAKLRGEIVFIAQEWEKVPTLRRYPLQILIPEIEQILKSDLSM